VEKWLHQSSSVVSESFVVSDEEIMRNILAMLTVHEREALHRFYVLGQTNTRISREMSFDEKALRELKARAKKHFFLWKHRLHGEGGR